MTVFKIAKKVAQYLGYFCMKFCHKCHSKITQSGHTGLGGQLSIFVLFLFSNQLQFQFVNINWKMRGWRAWDSNPGPQNGMLWRNHAPTVVNLIRHSTIVIYDSSGLTAILPILPTKPRSFGGHPNSGHYYTTLHDPNIRVRLTTKLPILPTI